MKKHLIVHIGGSWFRCLICKVSFKADCPCCEPQHNCEKK